MRWKISWLQELDNQYLDVDEIITFDKKMFHKISNIDSVSPIKVKGYIKIENDLVLVNLNFSGVMKLVDANDGELIDYPFSFDIDDSLDDSYQEAINYQKDFIDLYELTWQHLVIETPTYYRKKNLINKKGKDWQLLSEDEYHSMKKKQIDPRLAKLKDLVIKNEED
jgi:uncharacterized protein